jgi:hypothetical protein
MKSLSIVLFLLAACDLALAKEVPLPRAKPPSLRAAHPPSAAPVPEVLPLYDVEAWPSDCALRLAEIARFAHQPSLNGPGRCGASDVVRLGPYEPRHPGPVAQARPSLRYEGANSAFPGGLLEVGETPPKVLQRR